MFKLSASPATALWNRNYFLRFRFRLLKSYGSGSGSYFRKVTVPVPVSAPHLDLKKQIFSKKMLGHFFAFLLSRLFYKEKVNKFQQSIEKCE
jgi:hypothetical protein